tara:strand:- start:433 stop:1128 length:696 start_codon:yes stop_codon:yes gene_type:complete
MRINKFISNSGYCSRRDAEKLIFEKKVYINSKLCEGPYVKINKDDKVTINNKIIKYNNEISLWKMYKPIKTLCTNKDPKKRKTIFDIIPKTLPRLISVGRLDYMSDGLILLTNNGDFARKLELPSSNILRVYRVCVIGKVKSEQLNKIKEGLIIDGISYKKIEAKIEKMTNNKTWLKFKLKEGKNREIRKICHYFKWSVNKLTRLQYGSVKLKKEKPGQIVKIELIPEDFK